MLHMPFQVSSLPHFYVMRDVENEDATEPLKTQV
jgi:hypothetical protein